MDRYVWDEYNRQYLAGLCQHSDQDFNQGSGRATFGELAERMNRYYFSERDREYREGPWSGKAIFDEINRDRRFYGRPRRQFHPALTLSG
jgi:hypothetical protein